MEETKSEFLKVAVKRDTKREIDLIAASEQRSKYLVIQDMLETYKAVKATTLPKPKGGKRVKVVEAVKVH